MKILSLCTGVATSLPGHRGRTGIAKAAVSHPLMLDTEGLVGDAIVNRKHHGGPDQAVYLEGALTLAWWEETLGRSLPPGQFGENLVIGDLDNRDLAVGDRLQTGDILLEVTAPRTPCATFAARMEDPGFVKRYTRAARPGAYCRVLSGGLIEAGMAVTMTPYAGDRVLLSEMLGQSWKTMPEEVRKRYRAVPLAERLRSALGEA